MNQYNRDLVVIRRVVDVGPSEAEARGGRLNMDPMFKMWKETLLFVLASFIFGLVLGKLGF